MALADFNRAVELDPDDGWGIARRGETYRAMGQYDEALVDLNRAIKLDPDSDWHLYQRALVYQVLGQPGKVKDDANAAIQHARQNYEKDAQDWQNALNLALYYLAVGATGEAEQLYREASGKSLSHTIYDAINDLDDFLTVFQDHTHAGAMRELLQRALESMNNNQAPASTE